MKDVEILSMKIQHKDIYNRILITCIGDKLVAKRANEKFRRIKGSTLVKLLNGINMGESVYNWKGAQNGEEEFKISDMMQNDNESVYSMRTDATQQTSVTVATD